MTVLRRHGVDLAGVRREVERRIATGDDVPAPRGPLPFTAEAKKVLESALEEAALLRHADLGTGHLLLGILRVDCCAARVLVDHGVDPDRVRRDVAEFPPRSPT